VPDGRARIAHLRPGHPGRRHRSARRVSAVIPAKNEARNIPWVLERLPVIVDEVVLVDGLSVDGTVEVARDLRPDIVVVHEMQRGKGAALRAGFRAASGEYVVMLDADGSMDPLEIPRFVSALDAGADLVKGTRFSDGGDTADMSWLRATGNRVLLKIANAMYRTSHTDLCYGFAAFRRSSVLALELDAVGFEIEAQLFLRAVRHQLRVAEIGSFEAPRRFGTSNLNAFRDGWRVLETIVGERVRRPSSNGRTIAIEGSSNRANDGTPPDGSDWSEMTPTSSGSLPLIRDRRAVVETIGRENSP
jgi:glycosyltransferase involved in cell wall biosynthesis